MKKTKSKKIITVGAVIGLLVFLHLIKVLAPVERVIMSFLNPIAGDFYSTALSWKDVYEDQNDKRDLQKVIADLEEENRELLVESARIKLLEEENTKLRQQLRFLVQNEYNYTLANVLYQESVVDSDEGSQNIFIDKGSKDGLVVGLIVVDDKGIVVGEIDDVKDSISEVSLVTNKECKLSATLQNHDKTMGVVEGKLGLTMEMNFIPQTEKIVEDQTVVTFGLEKNIPHGLVIGRVQQVENNSNEVWQSAIIEPLADLGNLTIVSVIQPQ